MSPNTPAARFPFTARKSTLAVALAALFALGSAGCSSTPTNERKKLADRTTVDQPPQLETAELMQRADRAIQDYAIVVNGPNTIQAGNEEGQIRRYLLQLEERHRNELFALARDSDAPVNQAIAVTMLGFSPSPDALGVILSALSSPEEPVVANAVFALAVRKDPTTPPGVLRRVVFDEKLRVEVRACAAWALHEVQVGSLHPEQIEPIWLEILARPRDQMDASISVSAIRGIGLMRNKEHARLVASFIDHPTPKIREATCIALERIADPQSWRELVTRLDPVETNLNVRLAAQKALEALAGMRGEQYDAKAWRRVFERRVTDQ